MQSVKKGGDPKRGGRGEAGSSAKDTKCDVDVILARAGALQSLDST